MSGRVFLSVAGNIGSGKTTLTRRLSERLGLVALYEETADNPYLADFYGDMPRWAMALQLRFLAIRVAATREALERGVGTVQDRTCYEDAEIFAANLHHRGAMDGRDWETYSLVAEQLLADLEPPDLLVYLRRSPASCAEQVARRGREYEEAMPRDYLEDLGARYDAWFGRWNLGPKLLVEAEGRDLRGSERDLDELVGRIVEALPQRPLFL